ncbi:MAG: DUF4229 domain-containing protein [Ornithinibacter sp.]
MMRYTVLRIVIFLACITALWLAGLRGQGNALLLVAGSAVLSALISFFALRRVREDYSAQLAERLERRTAAKRTRSDGSPTDEAAEDAETSQDDGQFR